MSVVLGYACNEYCVLLCDKRATEKNGDMRDNVDKLCAIPNIGWISAVGHAGLAEAAFKEIRDKKADDIFKILNIYQPLHDMAIDHNIISGNDESMLIANIFDCQLKNNEFNLVCIGSNGHRLEPLSYQNHIIMNGPGDDVYDIIKSKHDYGRVVGGTLTQIVNKMQLMFSDISHASRYVSDRFDVGIAMNVEGKISLGRIEACLPVLTDNLDWLSTISWL